MFHCAHQVTEIGVVGLIAGNMNEIGVRKVFWQQLPLGP